MGSPDAVERILVVAEQDAFATWKAEPRRDAGIRHRLLPAWCKALWNPLKDEAYLVPERKFLKQPEYHYGEVYSMAVIERIANPTSWWTLTGEDVVATAPPDWLTADDPFETLYECFRLLDGEPAQRGPYAYGEEVMRRALVPDGGRAASALREIRAALTEQGCKTTQPDLLALPRRGGDAVGIEVKRLGRDRMSPSQVNGFELLRRCGIRCEVWWIAEAGAKASPPSVAARGAGIQIHPALTGVAAPTISVRRDVDWDALLAAALARRGRGTKSA